MTTADTPTRARPFAGSPATKWATGAAAIEAPEAKAVDVEEVLRLTKEYLVAANLAREVLYGADPKTGLGLIEPLEKDHLALLRSGLSRPTVANDLKWDFTRFDPDEVELVGSEVKVRGRMTVPPGPRRRGLGPHQVPGDRGAHLGVPEGSRSVGAARFFASVVIP